MLGSEDTRIFSYNVTSSGVHSNYFHTHQRRKNERAVRKVNASVDKSTEEVKSAIAEIKRCGEVIRSLEGK